MVDTEVVKRVVTGAAVEVERVVAGILGVVKSLVVKRVVAAVEVDLVVNLVVEGATMEEERVDVS